jgi:hypothetical protein
VGDQQGGEDGQRGDTLIWPSLQDLEQPLDFPVVGHDQIDDVCTHDTLLHVVETGCLRQRSLYPHWTD